MNLLLHRHYITTRTKSNVAPCAEPFIFYLTTYLHFFLFNYLSPLGSYIPEGLMTSCTWDYVTHTMANRSYTMMLCCFVFFIPLAIIFYCYLLMFVAIRKTTRYCNSYIREYSMYSICQIFCACVGGGALNL